MNCTTEDSRGFNMPDINDKANQPQNAETNGPAPENGEHSAGPLAAAQAEIAQLKEELQVARDQVLRTHAEFDNTRKRWQRERDEDRQYAAVPLLADLLQVWDNIARAIEAAEKSPDPSGLLAGFKMVAQQLTAVLEKHHCQEIPAIGNPFDPRLHEALLQQPSDKHPANTVSQVVRAGFKLHDRVIRPAQVIVSTGAASGF